MPYANLARSANGVEAISVRWCGESDKCLTQLYALTPLIARSSDAIMVS